MKIKWEEEDIIPGRYIVKPTDSGKLCCTRAYKIGYCQFMREPLETSVSDSARYSLIAITDGMVGKPKTKREIADSLTESGALPLATDHLKDMIESLRRQNEGVEGTAGR